MKKYIVEVFHQGSGGLFYWRIRMRNRKIVADSGEGYKRKSTMMRVLNNLLAAIKKGEYEVVEK